jgi:hypothetical protein
MTTKINATTSGLIESVDTSGVLEIQTEGQTAIIIGADQNANFATTGAITVPVGSTAQRPTPVNGMMRYNSNVSVFEVYANNTWSAANVTPAPVNTVAPVISGSAIVGQNLTSTTGTWSGSPTSYFYQWNANASPISGATSNVISLTLVENGANITCSVTAQNIAGNSSPATSNTLGPVILGTTVNYLIVAGGGGGGNNYGNLNSRGMGGGGAGGYLSGTTILQPANTYAITVGAGGAGGIGIAYPSTGTQPTNGSNTTFTGLTTAVGGGSGATSNQVAASGGSGGGGCADTNATGGSGTTSQGFAGGNSTDAANTGGAGGGGASSVGVSVGSGTGTGGAGGNGTSSSISGVASTYAVGGTGGASSGAASGSPANASTGNGGTGAAGFSSGTPPSGGSGGSGIVIVSYPGAQAFGGGVISTAGGNTIHTFYTSGSLVPLTSLNAGYFMVAGGGAGGTDTSGGFSAGGGGGGGVFSGSNVTIDSSSTYVITVGAGGATAASSGANSSFSALSNVAVGGGSGGYTNSSDNGASGGSGGGGSGATTTTGGAATSGQGFAGGAGTSAGNTGAGGGGGSGAVGGAGSTSVGGNGGNGSSSSVSGTATIYAGGGGGGAGFYLSGRTGTGGSGGTGGGGTGSGTGAGTDGTTNLGGGGGGSRGGYISGGAGGSGIVFITYPGSTPQMAGGNVTVVSNTVVHTFTSSGFLTPFVNVNNSLRFRSSASAYLSKTMTTPTNNLKWTFSAWVKRGSAFTTENQIINAGTAGSDDQFVFTSSSQLAFYVANGASYYLITNAVYRDPAAWYHIVFVYDSANATASNRLLMYVNGTQVTSFATALYPTQNYASQINSAVLNRIGLRSNSSSPFDGYMTEVRLIDGQALTPNSFGTFNQYGVWQPVAYAGSYGTNGFYLPFTNTANTTALGYDFSPQGNNWTPTNISLTAGATYDSMKDVPTLTSANVANYCVINPLDKGTNATVDNGNLRVYSSSGWTSNRGTMAYPSTGKYYFEWVYTSNTPAAMVGIATYQANKNAQLGSDAYGWGYHYSGDKYNNNTATAYGASYTTGDVIGVALDMDAGTLTFYKNNTSQGTAFSSLTGVYFPVSAVAGATAAEGPTINFGQQPFVYTPPSGYIALNAYNL